MITGFVNKLASGRDIFFVKLVKILYNLKRQIKQMDFCIPTMLLFQIRRKLIKLTDFTL